MKKVLQMVLIFIIFCLAFVISFHLPTRKLMLVYTYFGFTSLIILTILLIFLLYLLIKKSILKFDIKDCIIIALLCFFVNVFFFGMVPVTIERSISVFMINEMHKNGMSSKDEITENFVNKYVYEYDAFGKRLEEQTEINTIDEMNGQYDLSNKGKFMLNCFKVIDKIYGINSNLLK